MEHRWGASRQYTQTSVTTGSRHVPPTYLQLLPSKDLGPSPLSLRDPSCYLVLPSDFVSAVGPKIAFESRTRSSVGNDIMDDLVTKDWTTESFYKLFTLTVCITSILPFHPMNATTWRSIQGNGF